MLEYLLIEAGLNIMIHNRKSKGDYKMNRCGSF